MLAQQLPKVKKEPNVYFRTTHFVILWAYTKPPKWGLGRIRYALIELTDPDVIPSRIDKRLKAVKKIIRIEPMYRNGHKDWRTQQQNQNVYFRTKKRNNRVLKELLEMMRKGEELWPCHFMVKGFPLPELKDDAQANK